jgi:site-specific DNA recombinase|nr:MAG TPA: integrase [Caudoviricetes sp.]
MDFYTLFSVIYRKKVDFMNNISAHERAALYVRVSTRYQVDKDSLPFQKKKLKEYCKLLNISDYEIFEDDGYSAKNTDRPKFQEMMHKVRSGHFTKLIVYKVDRVSRNLLDFASMYKELKDNHVAFISMNEQFDTSTAIGEAMLKIILIFAELERNMTSERVTSIMLNRAEEGLWNGARMPIGYKWDDNIKFPVPDENEAKLVQYIFDEYERTHSCSKVLRNIVSQGIKGKRGGKWTSKLINDVIRNPFYIGTYRYNMRESARGRLKPQSEWIIKENNHTPIISKEQFERCNRIMDSNGSHNTAKFRHTVHVHIFSNKLKCAYCGSGFNACKDRARANGYRPSVYRCNRRAALLDCPSKTISDTVLGEFIFNYIANLITAQKNFTGDIKVFEASLLSGNQFNRLHINRVDLEKTYNIMHSTGSHMIKNIMTDNIPADDNDNSFQLDIYIQQKNKYKKAIERLTDLYIYDPESMSKSQFTVKRKELQDNIKLIDNKIAELSNTSPVTSASDMSFVKKASAFLVSRQLIGGHIDFVNLAMNIDNNILKDFINQTIDYVLVKDGHVAAIRFINGLEHNFE